MDTDKIQLSLDEVMSDSLYILVFSCMEYPDKKMPLVVGEFEAVCISYELQGKKMSRPMTYELLSSFIELTGCGIKDILIYKFNEGIFYSKLRGVYEGVDFELDARTSDAVAVALRLNKPIYIYKEIFKTVSADKKLFEAQVKQPSEISDPEEFIASLSDAEIKDMIDEAVSHEDYETADYLHKVLVNRKNPII